MQATQATRNLHFIMIALGKGVAYVAATGGIIFVGLALYVFYVDPLREWIWKSIPPSQAQLEHDALISKALIEARQKCYASAWAGSASRYETYVASREHECRKYTWESHSNEAWFSPHTTKRRRSNG